MHDNRPIGIFDSGVGGLSILAEVKKFLPNEPVIYFADQKNLPYSEKSERELKKITSQILEFLIKKKAKAIIIACNTATVFTLGHLRSKFRLPIVGIVPVIKTAAQSTRTGRIGILSTVATSKSNYQQELIKKFANGLKVINMGTDSLVPFIERGEIRSEKFLNILKKELASFTKTKIDVLALGCSHYPFLKENMQKILGPRVLILDSSPAVARQVKHILEENQALSNKKGKTKFFTTGSPKKFRKIAEKLLGYGVERVYKARL